MLEKIKNSTEKAARTLQETKKRAQEAYIMEVNNRDKIRLNNAWKECYEAALGTVTSSASLYLTYAGISIESLQNVINILEHPYSATPKHHISETSTDELPTFVPIPLIRRLRP